MRVLCRWKFIFASLLISILLLIGHYSLPYPFLYKQLVPDPLQTTSNYFLTEDDYNRMGFLVNTSKCKIPAIEPWNFAVVPFTENPTPPIDCKKRLGQWTYVNKSIIVLNETAVEASGYKTDQLYCCYRSIHRDPTLSNSETGWYSTVVDSRVVYSKTCTPFTTVTEPSSEFIFVTCEPKHFYWYFDERLTPKVVYKNYHIIVPKWKSLEVHKKIKFWKNKMEKSIIGSPDNRPPNVIVLGIDATSRLNFQRSMPKTIKILKTLGAHEMLGFTKVGENTFPNLVALLTGHDTANFRKVCWYTRKTKLDLCPFVWKRFSEANYLTAEIQDSPRRNNWNFEKTGFVEPPTSFYIRPFLLGIHLNAGFYVSHSLKEDLIDGNTSVHFVVTFTLDGLLFEPGSVQKLSPYGIAYLDENYNFCLGNFLVQPNRVDCIGYQTVEEVLVEYMKDLIEDAYSSRTPVFLMSWLTQLAHDSLNSLQFADSTFAGMLESLMNQEALDNTILIMASDHGYRYGGIRQTLAGYYEDKLPNLWISLPPWIREKYPEWETALIHNSRMLTTPFDIYHTFGQILDTFSNTSEKESKTKSGSTVRRENGQSLFKPISESVNCDSAGVPESFCACDFPVRLPESSEILLEAAVAGVKYLNDILPKQCSPLTLLKVKGGAGLNKLRDEQKQLRSKIIVEFITTPGEFVLEATVTRIRFNFNSNESTYRVEEDVQRLSQFNTDVSCVDDPAMQLYCFC